MYPSLPWTRITTSRSCCELGMGRAHDDHYFCKVFTLHEILLPDSQSFAKLTNHNDRWNTKIFSPNQFIIESQYESQQ